MPANIYEKMTDIKVKLADMGLAKTGKNKHSGFSYYELGDILPSLCKLCQEHKLYTHTTFNDQVATLTIVDTENPSDALTFTSPMKEIAIAGSNAIQSLGGVETYQRRYLLLMAFDITEPDTFDANAGSSANREEGATSEQIQWIKDNCDVASLLRHINKPSLLALTKTEASSIITAKKKQLEANS